MKSTFRAILLFVTLLIMCQLSAQAQGWYKLFQFKEESFVHDMVTTEDGGFLVTGGTYIPGDPTDFLLLKVNAEGDSVWSKSPIAPFTGVGTSLIVLDDGSFFLTGGIFGGMYLMKLTAEGEVEWSQVYTEIEYLAGIAEAKLTADGGIIIAANAWNASSSVPQGGILFKVDVLGNVLWDNTLFTDIFNIFQDVIELDNGNFIVLSYGASPLPQAPPGTLNAIAYSPDGVLIWQKELHTVGAGGFGEPTIHKYNNDFFVTVNRSGSGFVLRRYDEFGNEIWEKSDNDFPEETNAGAVGVRSCLTLENELVISAQATTSNYGDLWIAGFSIENGDLQWHNLVDLPSSTKFLEEMASIPEGGFCVTGLSSNAPEPGKKVFLLKTNEMGQMVDIKTVPSPRELPKIRVYPNPASDFVAIEAESHGLQELKTLVYDGNGKLVHQLFGQQLSFDVSAWSRGTYFLAFYEGDTLLRKEKLEIR